jgi:hypothetical protein
LFLPVEEHELAVKTEGKGSCGTNAAHLTDTVVGCAKMDSPRDQAEAVKTVLQFG